MAGMTITEILRKGEPVIGMERAVVSHNYKACEDAFNRAKAAGLVNNPNADSRKVWALITGYEKSVEQAQKDGRFNIWYDCFAARRVIAKHLGYSEEEINELWGTQEED